MNVAQQDPDLIRFKVLHICSNAGRSCMKQSARIRVEKIVRPLHFCSLGLAVPLPSTIDQSQRIRRAPFAKARECRDSTLLPFLGFFQRLSSNQMSRVAESKVFGPISVNTERACRFAIDL